MQPKQIDERLSVAPQIDAADVADLAAAGFRAIVCNRPDGEGPDQPTQAEIAAAATASGLAFRYLPIVSGQVGDEDAAAFAAALDELPGPVLAYCRTGTRLGRGGRALFTQPPMPIKCAGAPQKALYLSADHWRRNGRLEDIDIVFMNAGGVLFGVKDYVPALMDYVARYHARLNFFHNLVSIDGLCKIATFEVRTPEQAPSRVDVPFDMIHVCPPQTAPDFIRVSPLADAAGWVDVDQQTLRHKSYPNVWSLGDVMNAPNAKTAAAARKQAPTVAENLVADMAGRGPVAAYDGYGSCPLTVERGKIVLAEFGYGGALKPSFPAWMLDGTKPSRLAWLLKERLLPPVYWRGMLRGHEWMAKPEPVTASAA